MTGVVRITLIEFETVRCLFEPRAEKLLLQRGTSILEQCSYWSPLNMPSQPMSHSHAHASHVHTAHFHVATYGGRSISSYDLQ